MSLVNLAYHYSNTILALTLDRETIATEEIFKLLFMHHLTFEFGGTEGVIKDPKVSVLQANAKLVQKG